MLPAEEGRQEEEQAEHDQPARPPGPDLWADAPLADPCMHPLPEQDGDADDQEREAGEQLDGAAHAAEYTAGSGAIRPLSLTQMPPAATVPVDAGPRTGPTDAAA